MNHLELFQTTKIQTFESNSQRVRHAPSPCPRCFRLQRYKLLKAIHNFTLVVHRLANVVSDYKDTNFWKQFTTLFNRLTRARTLFQTTKIQTFESNSQHGADGDGVANRCFRLQRYKLLKAIHNTQHLDIGNQIVVSDYKDTNFWKQFTTATLKEPFCPLLFQTTKIQTFESNSQLS